MFVFMVVFKRILCCCYNICHYWCGKKEATLFFLIIWAWCISFFRPEYRWTYFNWERSCNNVILLSWKTNICHILQLPEGLLIVAWFGSHSRKAPLLLLTDVAFGLLFLDISDYFCITWRWIVRVIFFCVLKTISASATGLEFTSEHFFVFV